MKRRHFLHIAGLAAAEILRRAMPVSARMECPERLPVILPEQPLCHQPDINTLPSPWQQLLPEDVRFLETPISGMLHGLNYEDLRFVVLPNTTDRSMRILAPLLPPGENHDDYFRNYNTRKNGAPDAQDIALRFAAGQSWVDAEKYLMTGNGTAHKAAALCFAMIATDWADSLTLNTINRKNSRKAFNAAAARQTANRIFFRQLTELYDTLETQEHLTASMALKTTHQFLREKGKTGNTHSLNGHDVAEAVDSVMERVLVEQAEARKDFEEKYPLFETVVDSIRNACRIAQMPIPVCYGIIGSESRFDPSIVNQTTGATGLFQYQEQSWLQAIKALDRTDIGREILTYNTRLRHFHECIVPMGKDGNGYILYTVIDPSAKKTKDQYRRNLNKRTEVMQARGDPELNALIGMTETKVSFEGLKYRLERDPQPSEMWLANILSPARAANFILATRDNPELPAAQLVDTEGNRILSEAIIKANPLFDRKAGQVLQRAKDETFMAIEGALLLEPPTSDLQALRSYIHSEYARARPTPAPSPLQKTVVLN